MSHTRPYLLTALDDPEKQAKYLLAVDNRLANGMINRMFDDVEDLAHPDEMDELKKKFLEIFAKIPEITNPMQDPRTVLSIELKTEITNWQKELITKKCSELLNDKCQFRKEFIDKLCLHPYQAKLVNGDVVCAYLGTLNNWINDITLPQQKENPIAGAAIIHYISANYGNWVRSEIKKRGYEAIFRAAIREIVNAPRENPEIFYGTLSALAVAGLTTLGVFLIKKFTGSDNSSSPQNNFKGPGNW